jgi:hypothetical protein
MMPVVVSRTVMLSMVGKPGRLFIGFKEGG